MAAFTGSWLRGGLWFRRIADRAHRSGLARGLFGGRRGARRFRFVVATRTTAGRRFFAGRPGLLAGRSGLLRAGAAAQGAAASSRRGFVAGCFRAFALRDPTRRSRRGGRRRCFFGARWGSGPRRATRRFSARFAPRRATAGFFAGQCIRRGQSDQSNCRDNDEKLETTAAAQLSHLAACSLIDRIGGRIF